MGISAPILVLVVSITHYIVGKIIIGKNRKKLSDTNGFIFQISGAIILLFVIFISYSFLDIMNPDVMKWFWLCILIIILGFNAFLEWKYLNGTKEYIVTLIALAVGLIFVLIVMF